MLRFAQSLCWTGVLLVLLLAVPSSPVRAGSIVVDEFSSPVSQQRLYTSPDFGGLNVQSTDPVTSNDTTDVLGAERQVVLDVRGPVSPVSAAVLLGTEPSRPPGQDGIMQVATGGPSPTVVSLIYNGLGTGDNMDVDLTDGGTNDRFELKFLLVNGGSVDGGMSMSILIDTPGLTSAAFGTMVSDSLAPQTLTIPFSAFTVAGVGADPFTNASRVTFRFNGNPTARDVDFIVDSIGVLEAVPEPSTIALAMAGVVGCLAGGWRRMRRFFQGN